MRPGNDSTDVGRRGDLLRRVVGQPALLGLWLLALALLLAASNPGVLQRLQLLAGQQRWGTLVAFVGVWGLCVASLIIAAFQQRFWIRVAWAIVFAATATAGAAFRAVSGSELTVFDVVSLWSARHEAARAAAFYGSEAFWPAVLLLFTLLVVLVRPRIEGAAARRWLARMALAPVIPVVAIASIVMVKEGGGSQALPVQFAPLSVGIVSGVRMASIPPVERRQVEWTASAPKVRHIVVLVDESVRSDYIDLAAGNSSTPALAGFADRIVDFGPAASGGNCSHYSNAILRFVAAPGDLGGPILGNPTLWQYAKAAGFETVFIDAQSAFNKTPGKVQNFMTAEEVADIDRFYTMESDVPVPMLDQRLLDILLEELKSETPTLIYANKNGAHFPYDQSYPASERPFGPAMSDAGEDTLASRVNSYRNAVRWSVDGFFARLFGETDLGDAVLIYTSDHGQVFDPQALSHCSVEEPDPREGIVPLFVSTGEPQLRARFEAAAEAGYPRTHFAIMPTVLDLLGYADADIAREKGDTLLEAARERIAFSSGDIFGLFSLDVRWHDLDVQQVYLEDGAGPVRVSGAEAATPPS